MRKDETGQTCPETLGEYRDLCMAFGGPNAATDLLDDRIAQDGRDEVVVAPDSQMRLLLMPLLAKPSVRG